MKLVLASASPRRARLLREEGFEFDVAPSSVPEDIDSAFSPEENALMIAVAKAEQVAASRPGGIVLAADTIVVLNGDILGKPVDEKDARRMLRALSGREHRVITAVAVIRPSDDYRWSHVEISRVRFAHVPDGEIEEYVGTGEPLDKAGAYAIQGGAKKWIESFEGSLSNIIGLPMEPLLGQLEKLGLGPRRTACR